MDKHTFDCEGRASEECREASRQVLGDSLIWEVILVLLVAAALVL